MSAGEAGPRRPLRADPSRFRPLVGWIAVALGVLALAPSGAAASSGHALSPPYRHTSATYTRGVWINTGCRMSAGVSSTRWIPATGNVTGFVHAAATSCPAPPTGVDWSYGYGSVTTEVRFPVKVASGAHNFTVNYSYALTVATATLGTIRCPVAANVHGTATAIGCYLQIAATTRWTERLFDATNQTFLGGPNSTVQGPTSDFDQTNFTSCNGAGTCTASNSSDNCTSSATYYYGNCAPSGRMVSGTNSTWVDTGRNCGLLYAGRCYAWHNWTLNGTHQYDLVVDFFEYAWVDLYHYLKGGGISASVNAATLGNTGWKITSVTIR